ncbi:CidA/LrgA family protein [Methylocella sp.]|uniref:CidA/LrgA family protein n=1 Tax=Methylocella sp. TaxID=1978226 RepID=UPI0035B0A3C8
MIHGFVLLLVCQLAGESVSRGLRLPVPGPVVGLVLMLLGLFACQRLAGLDAEALKHSSVGKASAGVLQNLALLFVPAGVGVVQHLRLLADDGIVIALALVVSTAATLAVTGLVFVAVARRTGADAEKAP